MIILDVSRGEPDFKEYLNVLNVISEMCFIPITAGGWIRDLKQIKDCMNSGADKILFNQPIYDNYELVINASNYLGSQSIVASIDYKVTEKVTRVYTDQGTRRVNEMLDNIIARIRDDVGELLLTSIDKDGTGMGYDYNELGRINPTLSIPIVISGGAGNELHLKEALCNSSVNAVATANLFNFIGNGLEVARKHMIDSKIDVPIFISDESIKYV